VRGMISTMVGSFFSPLSKCVQRETLLKLCRLLPIRQHRSVGSSPPSGAQTIGWRRQENRNALFEVLVIVFTARASGEAEGIVTLLKCLGSNETAKKGV